MLFAQPIYRGSFFLSIPGSTGGEIVTPKTQFEIVNYGIGAYARCSISFGSAVPGSEQGQSLGGEFWATFFVNPAGTLVLMASNDYAENGAGTAVSVIAQVAIQAPYTGTHIAFDVSNANAADANVAIDYSIAVYPANTLEAATVIGGG